MERYDSYKKRYTDGWICFIICLLVGGAFWQVTASDFIHLDDYAYVYQNSHVRDGFTLKGLQWAFSEFHSSNWHPLTWIFHMLDCELFGLNPGMHHLSNVLIHLVNSLLVFLFFKKATGHRWPSAAVAMIFAIHPLRVESVAWISEKKDVLSTFFGLLTLWAYIRYVNNRRMGMYIWVLIWFGLGLMAKQMLITLPCVLLLLDVWPLGRIQLTGNTQQKLRWLPVVMDKIPLFLMTAGASWILIQAQRAGGSIKSIQAIPLDLRISNAIVSYVTYLWKTIWPSHLAVFYPYPSDSIAMWEIIGSVLVLSGVSVFSAIHIRKHPYLLVGWLWYLGTLFPVIGVVQVGLQAMADRYTYIPHLGLLMAVVWTGHDIVMRWHVRPAVWGTVFCVVIALLTVRTYVQVSYWKNSETLFQYALRVTQNNFIAHFCLGLARAQAGNYPSAVAHFSKALEMLPDYAKLHRDLERVIRKKWADALIEWGHQYLRQGNTDQAGQHYAKAIAMVPEDPKGHLALGAMWLHLRQWHKALDQLHMALKLEPNNPYVHNLLGVTLASMGNTAAARDHFIRALELKPGDPDAAANLDAISSSQSIPLDTPGKKP